MRIVSIQRFKWTWYVSVAYDIDDFSENWIEGPEISKIQIDLDTPPENYTETRNCVIIT